MYGIIGVPYQALFQKGATETCLKSAKIKEQFAMSVINDELNKLGIACESISILQDKDGVTVARIASDGNSHVLKCFQKDEHKRELESYRLLESLGIPTIRVIASTDSALFLEEIDCSSTYRMGIEEDMADPAVAHQIAVWYKQLHRQGYSYVCQHGGAMYDVADFFTLGNIAHIKKKPERKLRQHGRFWNGTMPPSRNCFTRPGGR